MSSQLSSHEKIFISRKADEVSIYLLFSRDLVALALLRGLLVHLLQLVFLKQFHSSTENAFSQRREFPLHGGGGERGETGHCSADYDKRIKKKRMTDMREQEHRQRGSIPPPCSIDTHIVESLCDIGRRELSCFVPKPLQEALLVCQATK